MRTSRPQRNCPAGARERREKVSLRKSPVWIVGTACCTQTTHCTAESGNATSASITAPSQMQFWQSHGSPHGSGNSDSGASSLCEQQEHAVGVHSAPTTPFASHERQRTGHVNKLTINNRASIDFMQPILLRMARFGKIGFLGLRRFTIHRCVNCVPVNVEICDKSHHLPKHPREDSNL